MDFSRYELALAGPLQLYIHRIYLRALTMTFNGVASKRRLQSVSALITLVIRNHCVLPMDNSLTGLPYDQDTYIPDWSTEEMENTAL